MNCWFAVLPATFCREVAVRPIPRRRGDCRTSQSLSLLCKNGCGGARAPAAGAPMKILSVLLIVLLAGCSSSPTPDSNSNAALSSTSSSTTNDNPAADTTQTVAQTPTKSPTNFSSPPSAPKSLNVSAPKITIIDRNPYFEFSLPDGRDANWTYGDGASNTRGRHTYVSAGQYTVSASRDDQVVAAVQINTQGGPGPHVIVAISDSGVNPYHEVYRRPELTVNPCTYILDYPCLPALNLTLDAPSYEAAYMADQAKWAAITEGQTFWIPGTSIIGAVCHAPYTASPADDPSAAASTATPLCILGENSNHGTGTTSAVLRENPEALIVFQEAGSDLDGIKAAGLPFDVSSLSYGIIVPIPVGLIPQPESPFSFRSAGNDGRASFTDWHKGYPTQILVGGAGPHQGSGATGYWTTDAESGRFTDLAAPFCRVLPDALTLNGTYEYCGTSFSAPTAAGALSLTILRLRQATGYAGNTINGLVDGIHTIQDVRDAMNRTASYTPDVDGDIIIWVPVAQNAPWLSWGWGYFGRVEGEKAALHLLGVEQPAKDPLAIQFMAAQHQLRTTATAPGTVVCNQFTGESCT